VHNGLVFDAELELTTVSVHWIKSAGVLPAGPLSRPVFRERHTGFVPVVPYVTQKIRAPEVAVWGRRVKL
jgi:hypothetical protein